MSAADAVLDSHSSGERGPASPLGVWEEGHRGWLIETRAPTSSCTARPFDGPFWDKVASSISPDAVPAPDDALAADKLVEHAANATHSVRRLDAPTGGVTYIGSVFAKAAELAASREHGRTEATTELRPESNSQLVAAVGCSAADLLSGACADRAVGLPCHSAGACCRNRR